MGVAIDTRGTTASCTRCFSAAVAIVRCGAPRTRTGAVPWPSASRRPDPYGSNTTLPAARPRVSQPSPELQRHTPISGSTG